MELAAHSGAIALRSGQTRLVSAGAKSSPLSNLSCPKDVSWWPTGIHITRQRRFQDWSHGTDDWTRLAREPLHAWKDIVQNDFGAPASVTSRAALLTQLEEAGAAYVQMTGSGSTVFGLFTKEGAARHAAQLVGAGHCGPALRTQR